MIDMLTAYLCYLPLPPVALPKPHITIYVRNGHTVYETTNNINKWRATYTRLTGELR